jgi:Tfp pilus assembly protein PilZ
MSIWSAKRISRSRPNRTSGQSTTWGAAGVRRTEDRVDFAGRATLIHDGQRIKSESGNLSEGGAFLNMPNPPEVGESVRLMLTLDGKLTLSVDAIVRWHDFDADLEPFGCGVQFRGMDSTVRATLRDILIEAGLPVLDMPEFAPTEEVEEAPADEVRQAG